MSNLRVDCSNFVSTNIRNTKEKMLRHVFMFVCVWEVSNSYVKPTLNKNLKWTTKYKPNKRIKRSILCNQWKKKFKHFLFASFLSSLTIALTVANCTHYNRLKQRLPNSFFMGHLSGPFKLWRVTYKDFASKSLENFK